MPVYARINNPWAINEGWSITGGDMANMISCKAPDDEFPDDPFGIDLWIYFASSNFENEFTAGQVVEINGPDESLPVTDPTVIFSKT